MSKPRHIAKIAVSLECIREALHLPDDSYILDIEYDGYSGAVDMIIQHKDLPLLKEGDQVITTTPIVTQTPTGKEIPEYIYEFDWCVCNEH